MRNKPGVLPAVALAIVIIAVNRAERIVFLAEFALAVLTPDETKCKVEKMSV